MKKLVLTAGMLAAFASYAKAQVSFAAPFVVTHEAVDTLEIEVTAEGIGSSTATVAVASISGFGTASSEDYTLLTPTLSFDASGSAFVKIKVNNEALSEKAEQFALELSDAVNTTLGSENRVSIFIKDNDYTAPVATTNIELEHLGSYALTLPESSVEILAYDATGNKLFVVNSLQNKLHVLDMSTLDAIEEIAVIDMSEYGGGITSVAVHDTLVAVAVHADPKTDNGKIVFLNKDGVFLKEVAAGALPDMVTFTPDGKYAIAANEGEPNGDYTVDPEGSVTVIDLQSGVLTATATQADFSTFNGMEDELRAEGVRIFGANNPSAAQDFEPEYITISKSSDTAWITLQENNAIAVLEIGTKTIVDVWPLGYVDHSLEANALDASDNNDSILIANWPVRGLHLPDAVANYSKDGQTYLITANEGDAREYDPLVEEVRIKNGAYPLDATVFPNASLLKKDYNIGRLNALNTLGDTDGDGDFDEIYIMGGRGFSIRNASNGSLVYNSGDAFEQITANHPEYGVVFNANNEESNDIKNRSDNKGPEPEGVAIGTINDTAYAFIALERTGGIMVYNVNNPTTPTFVQYINTRDLTTYGGDNGAEGMLFIHKEDNSHNEHLLLTANEISGTVAVFKVNAFTPPLSLNQPIAAPKRLNVYPNPSTPGKLYFSENISGTLSNVSGARVMNFTKANSINTTALPAGIYMLVADGYATQKIVLQ